MPCMLFSRTLRPLLLFVVIILAGLPARAETMHGRALEIFDGRADKTAAAPLVVAMHGFLGTSRNMRRKTGFNALARRHGFVVVYPNGLRRKWNDGRSARNTVDDVPYLSQVIETLIANGLAKRGQIFLTGHSNGGGMAMRMACDRPELVNAIAVVATKTPRNYPCGQGRPVPALFIHGTMDPISPHQGRPDGSRLGGALSSRETIALWRTRNRCSNNAQRRQYDRLDDGTIATITHYRGCAAALSFVEIQGHGHDWPRPGNKAARLQGPATQELDATSFVWQFFSHQK